MAESEPLWNEDGSITWVDREELARRRELDRQRFRRAFKRQYGYWPPEPKPDPGSIAPC